MGVWSKIRELRVGKDRAFRVLLAVELVLLGLGIIGLFGKDDIYEYGVEAMRPQLGAYSEEQGGVAAAVAGTRGDLVTFEGITLPAGTYRVQLRYSTDTDMLNTCEVTNDSVGRQQIRTNGTMLFAGLGSTDFEMWLLRDSADTVVHAVYCGTGTLAVQGLTICRTNAMNRILLFVCFVLITAVNVLYVYVKYDRIYSISVRSKTVAFCLGLVILAASLPMTPDYLPGGGDLVYHLMRVEGIRDNLLNGQFPGRISPEWQQGYGYASPIFYGETLLYPAALFRLIGFSVTTSCRLFMFGIVVATVLLAYNCFRKMFGEPYIGVFCSMVYTLSVYRIYKTYCCGSWGECFGILLLPLVVYGFHRILTGDVGEKSYKRSFIPLAVGLSLLVQSHLLTGEMAGFFIILLCVICWKRVFRPQTFLALAKAAICSILLSAWFLVPLADYMLTGDFVIQHVSGRTIQYRGLYPAHLLFTWFINGANVFFEEVGMYDSAAVGVGILPVAALILLGVLFWTGKAKDLSPEDRGLGKIAALFSVMAMLMSLSLFPWDRIQSWNAVTATLVSSIQFPNRFLTIANVGLTVVAGVVAKWVFQRKNYALTICCVGGALFLTATGSLYLTEHAMNGWAPLRIYNSEGMGTGNIAGAEYLPYGADATRFLYHDPVCTGHLEVREYQKLPAGARGRFFNPGSEPGSVAFPLLYYKGYRAFAENEELYCHAGNNFEVTVDIPEGFDGEVEIRFVSPWYWRAGEAVTVVALVAICLYWGIGKRREALTAAGRGRTI
ncbi:MAG: hypothetical protein NC079_02260 [Clostridium sp.]|nr:hypothetical protein [Acetatifactor muris]MCM1527408.1 hypothetical protein [Bacteroides sp.]MCM1562413.1 hypothetical protein [Clostridium sp.]